MTKTNMRSARIRCLEVRKLVRMMTLRLCISAVAMLAMLIGSRSAPGQCDSCNGRCNYCVDHQCYPRRQTFGHWETQWRRWPVPPPAVGLPETPSPSEFAPGDLPPAEEESSSNPDFSHRRKKASGPPAVEEPLDIDEPSPLKPDPFRDDIPDSSRKLGRNELRSGQYDATRMSIGYSSLNPLRETVPPEIPAVTIRASYNRLPPQPIRAVPRHANPLRGNM